MNFFKSMFISMFMMAAMMVSIYAAWSLWQTGSVFSWGGVLLTSAPIMMVISRIMMFQNVARTSAHFPLLSVLAIVGLSLSLWGYTKGGSFPALLIAAGVTVGLFLYSYWYSTFGREPSAKLRVGETLPPFNVKNAAGEQVSSMSLVDKPAIWIFYRGNWCPLCMAQIKELVAEYQQIQRLGVRVALISPQPHKNTQSLAKKFDVNFDFLTDTGNAAARVLGIENPYGLPFGMNMMGYDTETVLPTVIITDSGGRIVWAYETDNYRIRPEPSTYLSILKDHKVVDQAA